MKFIKCVGAINLEEVKGIYIFDKIPKNQRCFIMLNGFQDDFPEKFPFGNNVEAMKKIRDEASEGPFMFLVIFYEE